MSNEIQLQKKRKTSLGDFYWAHADILRGAGVSEAGYDQRILAFMALKLLMDNGKLKFNFEYDNQFGLSEVEYLKYKGKSSKETFANLLNDLPELGQNLRYFEQEAKYNPGVYKTVLSYFNHHSVFPIDSYLNELEDHYFEMILDIYIEKADFTNFPKEQYKDLYERTIARMRSKFAGELVGQHFTQKSIIHLMCEYALRRIKNKKHIAIYDPTCGTGSMVMESAYYFRNKLPKAKIEVFGQEMNGKVWFLSKIFLEICPWDGGIQGISNIIAFGNTLTRPAFADKINGDDSFDFIIANPPFGVDWKQDYEEIVKNMASDTPHFLVVNDGKKFITPRKSDGQFLFMMQIVRLLTAERTRGKHAIAAVISSSTLCSTGSETGSESKIRRKIFEEKVVTGLLEQPNAMFTNTDIGTHIWFFDNAQSKTIRLVRADNSEKPLYSPHPAAQDKMRNTYSDENITELVNILHEPEPREYVAQSIPAEGRHAINIQTEIGKREEIDTVDLDELEAQIIRELDLLIQNLKPNE
uniref:HsdM family class I SAM-dependent methyltransferase n=1 Tax=Algoriphagus sp. TaxID=1872435 RepID=UPI0025911D07|nr:N-6 DNA methylase [Algoriphagus sp.]